ncbi:MAG: hypothetical protein ACOYL6_17590 [Bacteriovoracaceae bacterium]
MKNILVILSLFFCQHLMSQSLVDYKVFENVIPKNIVLVESSDLTQSKVGDFLVYTFKDGEQCYLEVTKVDEKIVYSNSKDCPRAKELKKGFRLERSLLNSSSLPLEEKKVAPENVLTPIVSSPKTKVTDNQKFQDLNFLPIENSILVSLGASYEIQRYKEFLKVGSAKGEYKLNSKQINDSASFEYSLLDDLQFGVNITYTYREENKNTGKSGFVNNTPDQITYNDGLNDPSLFTKYRFNDDFDLPVIIDIKGEYSFSIEDAKRSSSFDNNNDGINESRSNDGNMSSGGSTFDLSLSLGKKLDYIEYQLITGFMRMFSGEITSIQGNDDNNDSDLITKFKPKNSFYIIYNLQKVFKEKFGVHGGPGLLFTGGDEISYTDGSNNTVSGKGKKRTAIGLDLGSNYLLVKDKLLLDLTLNFTKITDTSGTLIINGQPTSYSYGHSSEILYGAEFKASFLF